MSMYEARQNKEKVSRTIQFVRHKNSSNTQTSTEEKIISNRIQSKIVGNVAKAPIGMPKRIRKDAVYCVSRINQYTYFSEKGGANATYTRIDIQGSSFGNKCFNIQLQVSGNNPTDELTYPKGTSDKGTSLAEVHILKKIVISNQQDVINRGLHLLRSCLLKSLNDRCSYKISVPPDL